jgi:hypothetical protein
MRTVTVTVGWVGVVINDVDSARYTTAEVAVVGIDAAINDVGIDPSAGLGVRVLVVER